MDRFWSKVQCGTPDECWPWLAGRIPQGYGSFGGYGGRSQVGAHVVAYELCIAPVPLGRDTHVHHLCENKLCCNPAHLLLMDARDHGLLHSPRQTHCKHGHEFTEENALVWRGQRMCRACGRINGDRWAANNPERVRDIQRGVLERAKQIKIAAGTYVAPPAERTHCPKGHAYEGDNLIVKANGNRDCRACSQERDRKRAKQPKRKAQAAAREERRRNDPLTGPELREYKRKWAAERRKADPEYLERTRRQAREYQARKRAERVAAAGGSLVVPMPSAQSTSEV